MRFSKELLNFTICVTLSSAFVGCDRATILSPSDEEIAYWRYHDPNINGYSAAAKGFRMENGRWPADQAELLSFAERWQISIGAQPEMVKLDSLTDGILYVHVHLKSASEGFMVLPTPLTPAERQEAPLLVESGIAH